MSFEQNHPIEFRPGASTEGEAVIDEKRKSELERTKNFTTADHTEEFFASMLNDNQQYSETFKIKEDGEFDKVERLDGSAVHMGEADTPAELYQLAKEIQDKHPEYQFTFESDPEGKWLKYTVSKKESESETKPQEIQLESAVSSVDIESDSTPVAEEAINGIEKTAEELKEERRHAIISEIIKEWESKNGPIERPKTFLEIEAAKYSAGRDGKEWDGSTTTLTDKGADFYFAFKGGLSVPELADSILVKRFPEYQ